MEEIYNETKAKIKHLDLEERGKIEVYLGLGYSLSKISRILQRSKSTISKEVRKGRYKGAYTARIAEKRTLERREKSHLHTKWRNDTLLRYILKYLKLKWSPEIIAAIWSRAHPENTISHTFIYNLIASHRKEWKKYLIYKGKHKMKTSHTSKTIIPYRVDISERPQEISARNTFGDWEADTVVSARGGKSCLAVFVERKTRLYKIVKMKNKSANEMLSATIKALKHFTVRTITYDNGSENVNHYLVNQILGCKSYFCRPYRSSDKGSIENRNKILRQFLPKKTNFDLISDFHIANIEAAINNRPLKLLDWASPFQLSFAFCL